MSTDFSIVEGPYLRDLLDQPEALGATFANLDVPKDLRAIVTKLRRGRFRSIVLTGMGASFHALHPACIALVNHGIMADMVETSELVHYKRQLLSPENLLIVVSQSGRSAEVLRLLKINRRKSTVIAVTNTPGSPLAQKCERHSSDEGRQRVFGFMQDICNGSLGAGVDF